MWCWKYCCKYEYNYCIALKKNVNETFDDRLRQSGLFSTVSRTFQTEKYYLCYQFHVQYFNNFSLKVFVNGRQVESSKSRICIFHIIHPGKCVGCNTKKTHSGCSGDGKCKTKFDNWVKNPTPENWQKCYHSSVSMKEQYQRHVFKLHTATKDVIQKAVLRKLYLDKDIQSQQETSKKKASIKQVQVILNGIRKYSTKRDTVNKKRRNHKNILNRNKSTKSITIKREIAVDTSAVCAYKEHYNKGELILSTNNQNGFDSRCPNHINKPPEWRCYLRYRNTNKFEWTRMIVWNHPYYFKIKEIDCTKPGGTKRFYLTHESFEVKGNDYTEPIGYIKCKNNLAHFDFMATANEQYLNAQKNDNSWYKILLGDWISSYKTSSHIKITPMIKQMIQNELGTKNTLLGVLKRHQCTIYPYYTHCQTLLYFRRTPLTFSFDVTFNDSSNIHNQSLHGDQTTLTILDDLDNYLKIHLINGKGEGKEQIG
eukprot:222134_1